VIFTVEGQAMVLLHALSKQSRRTPAALNRRLAVELR
jgi:hypothetical protein